MLKYDTNDQKNACLKPIPLLNHFRDAFSFCYPTDFVNIPSGNSEIVKMTFGTFIEIAGTAAI